MTEIKSEPVEINNSPESIFDFVSDLTNLYDLLPQDKVDDWKGEKDQCSFKFQGAIKIKLVKESEEKPKFIKLISGEGSPVEFSLEISLEEIGENKTRVSQRSEADLNPFMKMMAQKPLKKLFDHISMKLAEKMG